MLGAVFVAAAATLTLSRVRDLPGDDRRSSNCHGANLAGVNLYLADLTEPRQRGLGTADLTDAAMATGRYFS
jgi:uncharacterized protein YjbI with pentapeptide repeats